jgi:hypothetical protein
MISHGAIAVGKARRNITQIEDVNVLVADAMKRIWPTPRVAARTARAPDGTSGDATDTFFRCAAQTQRRYQSKREQERHQRHQTVDPHRIPMALPLSRRAA